jgi:tRNA(Arg) A34 adenosine deaminase TadA
MAFRSFMPEALQMAEKAAQSAEVPVGAVVVHRGEVIAAAHNRVETDHDPSAHAEILALREAARRLNSPRLTECDLYVTLEPCPMCAQAIGFARIRRLYYGASDPKGGGIEQGARIFHQSTCHHRPEIYGGLMAEECGALLQSFFRDLRK